MILSHRIALDTTVKQRQYFSKAAGCARFTWNWALDAWNKEYKAGNKPTGSKLKLMFNKIKYQEFPWMKDLHRDCHSQPFTNLQKAFVGFFKKQSKKPKFHKKGRKDSFYISNDRFYFSEDGWSVKLPKIGYVKLFEKLRFSGKIMSATISRTANRWFISIRVEVEKPERQRVSNGVIGVDWGLKSALTTTQEKDGQINQEQIDAPKPLKKNLKKLQRLQRKASKRKKGGQNGQKLNKKIAKLHLHIANIRQDFWHKATSKLCRENQAIGIEDLNISGMIKNRKLSKAIMDVGYYEFKRQLNYKCKFYNSQLFIADRWYPSSKTCNQCGAVKKILQLSDRVFHCDQCGYKQDRDVNASENLFNFTKDSLYPRLVGNSRLQREKAVSSLDEVGTKPHSFLSTS